MYGTADTATRAVLVFGSASVLLSMVLTADTVVLAVLGFILEKGVMMMLTMLGFGSASVLLGLVLTVLLVVLGFSFVLILALGGLVS